MAVDTLGETSCSVEKFHEPKKSVRHDLPKIGAKNRLEMAGIRRESGTSRCGHVRYNIVCLWTNCADPTKRFGMVRVLLDLSEIRSEMVRISNAMTMVLIRLQCAFSGRVPDESGMFLPISLNRNCLLSMSCVRAGHNPLAEVVWDFGLLCLVVCYYPWSVLVLRRHLVFRWRRVCVALVCHFLIFFQHGHIVDDGDNEAIACTQHCVTLQVGPSCSRMSKSTSWCGPNLPTWKMRNWFDEVVNTSTSSTNT